MKPTLLILAAGMGSRYGGLKQIDGIGPNEEPIIEYSIYDAINSGFGKIIFVIRREFDKEFRSRVIEIMDEEIVQKFDKREGDASAYYEDQEDLTVPVKE